MFKIVALNSSDIGSLEGEGIVEDNPQPENVVVVVPDANPLELLGGISDNVRDLLQNLNNSEIIAALIEKLCELNTMCHTVSADQIPQWLFWDLATLYLHIIEPNSLEYATLFGHVRDVLMSFYRMRSPDNNGYRFPVVRTEVKERLSIAEEASRGKFKRSVQNFAYQLDGAVSWSGCKYLCSGLKSGIITCVASCVGIVIGGVISIYLLYPNTNRR